MKTLERKDVLSRAKQPRPCSCGSEAEPGCKQCIHCQEEEASDEVHFESFARGKMQ